MKIALCQINTIVGNFPKNKQKILDYYNRAVAMKANLVVFPELTTTGYPPQDLVLQDNFISQNEMLLKQIAEQSTIPIILGYIRKGNRGLYNSAALSSAGEIIDVYDKMLLPTYDVFDEERYFISGKSPKIWQVKINGSILKIGIQICEDLWDHDYDCKVTSEQKRLGAEIIINISASPYHEGRIYDRQDLIEEKVKANNIPFVYCNLVGAQDELIFDGESLVFDKSGKCLAQGKVFEEDLTLIDPFIPDNETQITFLSKEEKLYKGLCLGVKDYFSKTGHKEALVGLSGGIDSALVACIAVDALGSENVHGISMPSVFSSDHSKTDAKELADNLGIDYQTLPIQGIVDKYEDLLAPYFSGKSRDTTEENIQARIRGNLLMAFANKYHWLVLSTGNKTELALGYCTLYGDMSGGLAVISDLSKSNVYDLSKYTNDSAKYDRIPNSIITKIPSAELAENQVDPFDYEIVSLLVDAIIERQVSPQDLINDGYDSELVWDIYKRIRNNEYKRRQAAPGLRVSPKAFGLGRRIPIVNHYDGK